MDYGFEDLNSDNNVDFFVIAFKVDVVESIVAWRAYRVRVYPIVTLAEPDNVPSNRASAVTNHPRSRSELTGCVPGEGGWGYLHLHARKKYR